MVFKEKLTKKEISQIAGNYKQALTERGIKVKKLILFGSYAKGVEHDWSDVDFVVVSSSFGKKNPFDELTNINIIANEISPMIEAHPATPREFELGDSPWLAEAKKYGREITA